MFGGVYQEYYCCGKILLHLLVKTLVSLEGEIKINGSRANKPWNIIRVVIDAVAVPADLTV